MFKGGVEMGNWIRPKIDEEYVRRIKAKYPETARFNDKETIAWALERFLSFEEFVTEPIDGGD